MATWRDKPNVPGVTGWRGASGFGIDPSGLPAAGTPPGQGIQRGIGAPQNPLAAGVTQRTGPGVMPLGARATGGAATLKPGDAFAGTAATKGPSTGPEVASSPFGSQSGPGILENWFNQRATGTDAASEYARKRGLDALGDRFSASGGYNSGAARQADSDLIANIEAQRAGQLDSLAGGASAEHQGRLDSMFRSGAGLASGQAGVGSAYDLGAAGNMSAANNAMNQMNLNKAGVDSQANQALFNNLLSAYTAYNGGGSGK